MQRIAVFNYEHYADNCLSLYENVAYNHAVQSSGWE